MKPLIQIGLALWLVSATTAQIKAAQPGEKTLRVFDWNKVELQPPIGEIISTNRSSVLKIENATNVALAITILTVTNRSLLAKADSISCEIKYNDVEGRFILDRPTTNSLGPGPRFGRAYSAELALVQRFEPEAAGGDEWTNRSSYSLEGTSNWKPYSFSTGRTGGKVPIKLEFKLYLPSSGTLYLRPITLLAAEDSSTGWWSPQLSGLIGGIGGTVIGCLGGLIGFLVSKGKARHFVLALVKCFIALGILSTIAGLVAAVLKQPYEVWYALLLPGVILVLVFSLNLHTIQRRYDEMEIRRMTSMDATGS